MKYALNELEDEKSRFIESYQSLKSRYCDLLIPDDLDRILESDRQHIADILKRKSRIIDGFGGCQFP